MQAEKTVEQTIFMKQTLPIGTYCIEFLDIFDNLKSKFAYCDQ